MENNFSGRVVHYEQKFLNRMDKLSVADILTSQPSFRWKILFNLKELGMNRYIHRESWIVTFYK